MQRVVSVIRLVVAASATLLLPGCSFRVQTFVLAPGTQHGWVTIEQGNSTCPSLPEATVFHTISIPESRVLCTSSPTYLGGVYERYALLDTDGSSSPLKVGDLIHQRTSFTVGEPGRPCSFSGIQFYYGPRDSISGNNALLNDQAYLARFHPDCPGAVHQ
jgi:hypothetical protein